MKKFDLVKDFRGYVTKKDETNTSIRNLVAGSQNVIVNDGEKVEIRGGQTLLGAAATESNPPEGSFTWNTSTGTEIMLRGFGDELEIFTRGIGAWTRLMNGWASVAFDFTTWWDTSEGIDLLLFVAQDSNIYEWSGGIATLSSATATTLTKTGSTTWGEERFLTAGTRQVLINGTDYTYTGGEGTTTLTGVTPSPAAEPADSLVLQSVRTNTNQPGSGLTNSVIEMLRNQVYVGDLTSREVFVSKNSSFTDYTFSATRLPGEGALLTLDSEVVGMVPQEEEMYITAGKSDWYQTRFTLSSDLTKEDLQIKKLKTAPQGASQSDALIGKIKNEVVFVSNEPTLDTLGRIQDVITPQSKPLSDPIKPDFDGETFTGGQVQFWRNRIYVSAPTNSKVYIYDIERGFWFPPQIMSIQRFTIFEGDLYGHSSTGNETLKLFDGVTDNEAPIEYIAKFAYRNHGDRANLKHFDEYFSELYLDTATTLTLGIDYDFQGSTSQQEFVLDGSDTDSQFSLSDDISLGKKSLGKGGLGSTPEATTNIPKYRKYAVTRPIDHFEYQVTYSTSVLGANFEILGHGPNVKPSGTQDNKLRT